MEKIKINKLEIKSRKSLISYKRCYLNGGCFEMGGSKFSAKRGWSYNLYIYICHKWKVVDHGWEFVIKKMDTWNEYLIDKWFEMRWWGQKYRRGREQLGIGWKIFMS